MLARAFRPGFSSGMASGREATRWSSWTRCSRAVALLPCATAASVASSSGPRPSNGTIRTKLRHLAAHGERGEELRALQGRGVVRQCREPAVHAASQSSELGGRGTRARRRRSRREAARRRRVRQRRRERGQQAKRNDCCRRNLRGSPKRRCRIRACRSSSGSLARQDARSRRPQGQTSPAASLGS